MKEYTGEVINPVMFGGPRDFDSVKTMEFPRKCHKCGMVYPPDHIEAPRKSEDVCQPCIKRRMDDEKNAREC